MNLENSIKITIEEMKDNKIPKPVKIDLSTDYVDNCPPAPKKPFKKREISKLPKPNFSNLKKNIQPSNCPPAPKRRSAIFLAAKKLIQMNDLERANKDFNNWKRFHLTSEEIDCKAEQLVEYWLS